MRKHYIFVLLLTITSSAIFGQHLNVKISSLSKPNETSIAIDEKHPSHLLVGANINSYYTSSNGGLTWESYSQESEFGVWGDPVMVIDTAGIYYHFHLSKPEDGNYIDRIVCQKSTDRGLTFNNGSYTGLNGEKAQDKHWIDVDKKTNALYVTWTQFDEYGSKSRDKYSNILFSKSTDTGETWSDPVQINSVSGDCVDDDLTVEGAVPAVGPNGEIFVSWAGPNGIVFNKSTDGGVSWMDEELKIDSMPNGWSLDIPGIYRANGMPITKCDISGGPNHGAIYINWADQRNGFENSDLWLVKSMDNGETWTEPIRVNQDTTKTQQFFTWMDIDQKTGYLYFVYHDRRNQKGNYTDVYMTFSTDGGETFRDVKISEKPFLPNKTIFFGDYNNIVAHNNIVRPVWTRLDNNKLSVWTAIVDTESLINDLNKDLFVSYESELQTIYCSIGKETNANIRLLSIEKDEIKSWEKLELKASRNALLCKEPLEVGIYYLEVTRGGKSMLRPFIVQLEN